MVDRNKDSRFASALGHELRSLPQASLEHLAEPSLGILHRPGPHLGISY
jgi:hypothetical protein